MNALQHARFWVIVLFVGCLLMPALVDGDSAMGRLKRESAEIAQIFGPRYAAMIVGAANGIYRTLFIDTGLEAGVAAGHTTRNDQRRVAPIADGSERAGAAVNGYLYSALVHVYAGLQRGMLVVFWLVALSPLLIAVVVDGLTIRRVKVAAFGSFSPALFAIGTHAIVLAVFTPLVYMMFPTYVSPWFLPICAVVGAIPLSLAVANAARIA